MSKILQIVSFELNDQNLLEDWKKMSAGISASLKNDSGFISRDSAIGKNNKIFCILKWENKEAYEAVKKKLEALEMADEMKAFAKIANMQTMKKEFSEII